jgi:coenzyme F420-dependent glucose-6-phosphate dehydrogenase
MASRGLRLGYKLSAEQFGPAELVELAVAAEERGFDTAAISDRFQPFRHSGGHAPFSFAVLGAVCVRTRRIALGTSVVAPTFRYHPAVVAQAMGTLDCLAPGRIWLGVGTGEAVNEAPLVLRWPDRKERYARLKEAVELIRRLWSEERVTFDGVFYQTRKATIYDRPATPIPLYVAASGPSAARLAGRIGDGLICTSGKGMALYAETLVPNARAAAQHAGRDPDLLDLTIEMKVSFHPDDRRALADTRNWAELALSAEEKMDVDDPVDMERLAEALSTETVASRWIVSADADEHVERIRPYIDLGFRHLIFHAPGSDQAGFLKRYSEDVLPRLRRLAG